MLDRMVPATTASEPDAVEHELGFRDEAAVVAEPFMQMGHRGKLCRRLPGLGEAGALFTTDVAAWEAAKLRLLNASHSLLAYLGLATGKSNISDAVGEDSIRTVCRLMLTDDALPTISLPKDPTAPKSLSALRTPHSSTTAKVGSDGSQRSVCG